MKKTLLIEFFEGEIISYSKVSPYAKMFGSDWFEFQPSVSHVKRVLIKKTTKITMSGFVL